MQGWRDAHGEELGFAQNPGMSWKVWEDFTGDVDPVQGS